MIERPKYLDQLKAFQDRDLIKVVTGVRRCGKSTLLDMMREHLRTQGIPDERLIVFKMESMEFDDIREYRMLYDIVRGRIEGIERPYLFFDELQEVIGWERAVNSLRVDLDCDIYITGSNAYLLSSELATLLSGRYVEIEMLPLVFEEYLSFRGIETRLQGSAGRPEHVNDAGERVELADLFEDYLKFGGFPFLALNEPNLSEHRAYMRSLYETVIVRDILERATRRGRRSLRNRDLLESICRFMADNIGNENSANSLAKALRSGSKNVASDTVSAYIKALCEAYLFYGARRYDIKGKQLLKTNGKHYICDTGLRSYLDSYKGTDHGRTLENIVYLQLLYDGYEVAIGKLRDGEIDFIATRNDEKRYIQVTENMMDQKTLERELAPLRKVRDAYPKQVIVQDGRYPTNIDGIEIVSMLDFLCKPKSDASRV